MPFSVVPKVLSDVEYRRCCDLRFTKYVGPKEAHGTRPLVLTVQVPARHYFVFGQEVDTSLVDEKDRKACQEIYGRTRSFVAGGIRYLLEAREHDPYRDDAKRILYETVMKTRASAVSCSAGLACSWCIDGKCPHVVSPSN